MKWYVIVIIVIVLLNLVAQMFKEYRKLNIMELIKTIVDMSDDFYFDKEKAFNSIMNIVIILFLYLILIPLSIVIVLLFPLPFFFLKIFRCNKKQIESEKPESIEPFESIKSSKPVKPNKFRDFKAGKRMVSANIEKLYLRTTLPFLPKNSEIIYIENEYDPYINQYIKDNLTELIDFFKYYGYHFCYLPAIFVDKPIEEIVRYRNPDASDIDIEKYKNINSDLLLPYLVKPQRGVIRPALIRFQGLSTSSFDNEIIDGIEAYKFSYFEFESAGEFPMEQQFQWYYEHIHNDYVFYMKSLSKPDSDDDFADYNFSEEAKVLVQEIMERVCLLRQEGISQIVLDHILKPQNKLSRLYITKDYHLFLPDYNNMEIVMTPLPKAVFFLFLKHPEGIVFKDLCDYRKELLKIYKKITRSFSYEKIKKSISDVTNPTKNSINEKCARIREAFVSHFDEYLAQNYFVTGKRSMAKKIILDRELVEWEEEI